MLARRTRQNQKTGAEGPTRECPDSLLPRRKMFSEEVKEQPFTVITDADGHFEVGGREAGRYLVGAGLVTNAGSAQWQPSITTPECVIGAKLRQLNYVRVRSGWVRPALSNLFRSKSVAGNRGGLAVLVKHGVNLAGELFQAKWLLEESRIRTQKL